jgi:A/G-specific adenine glycosylase
MPSTPAAVGPSTSIPEAELPQFRRRLLDWFHRSKRDLEWRRTRNPYRIWISEVMLQQTRVAAVTPYYRKFCARFPTVRRLAQARPESVLRAWAGLGYYSRARNLHRAAQAIVARHAGKFPRELAHALTLPGIGGYTAAAVLSIAYDEPHAVLDGNVARVLARLGAVRGDLRQPKKWRDLQKTASRLLAPKASGDWNQAMMELGATLCTPRAPRCEACPVERWCRARSLGIAERLPSARRKPPTVRMTLAAAVLLDAEGRTLMVRQNENALFSRLWQFPAVSLTAKAPLTGDFGLGEDFRTGARHPAAGRNPGAQLASHLATLGLGDVLLEPIATSGATSRHAVTFHDIRLAPFIARVARLPEIAGTRTPRLTELHRLPISSATRKIAAAALASLSTPHA